MIAGANVHFNCFNCLKNGAKILIFYDFDNFFKDGVKIKIPSEISLPFKVSRADEEDIETEDEESRGSDTTEEKRIGSTLCSLIGVSK